VKPAWRLTGSRGARSASVGPCPRPRASGRTRRCRSRPGQLGPDRVGRFYGGGVWPGGFCTTTRQSDRSKQSPLPPSSSATGIPKYPKSIVAGLDRIADADRDASAFETTLATSSTTFDDEGRTPTRSTSMSPRRFFAEPRAACEAANRPPILCS